MAGNRLVDRAKAAASRSAAESPTDSHQRRYKADLAHEIGPTTFGRAVEDEGDSLLQTMTQPAMILILAIITFALTFIVLMWREGRLEGLFPEQPTVAVKDPKAWMLGRNADGVIEDTQPSGEAPDATAAAPAERAVNEATSVKETNAAAEHDAEPADIPATDE